MRNIYTLITPESFVFNALWMFYSIEKSLLKIMTKDQVVLALLVHLSIIASALSNRCVPANQCPEALKYLEKKHNDPETIRIFRNAHCGSIRQFNVICNKIPTFEELPKGCISLSGCPAAVKLKAASGNDPEMMQLLNDAACGYGGKRDMIICDNLVPTLKAVERIKSHLLPKKTECGLQQPVAKITFGQRADFEDFPWLALLGYKDKNEKMVYRCHGTLISKRYVVTAAHCLKYTLADRQLIGNLTKIVLGEYDTNKTQDCHDSSYGGYCTDPVQEFFPESIHIHPNFESPEGLSDIALIRLNKDANYSDFVRPICIPLESIILKPHDTLLIGGWGKTEKNQPSTIKLKAQIQYLAKEKCARFSIDHTQICAGSTTGQDTCRGDSGGPLMALRQSADREQRSILVGVVSFGGKCGAGAAIYTNVSTFVNWILETIHE